MGIDHVGPFLFTKLLAPKLLAVGTAGYTPRVVYTSSIAHAYSPGIKFDEIGHLKSENYTGYAAYFDAKSAPILTAIELSKRSKGAINAFHFCLPHSPPLLRVSLLSISGVPVLLYRGCSLPPSSN